MRLLAFPPGVTAALLAGVAAAIVGLYLLKPAPRRIVVASMLIWDRVLQRKRRDAERWRWWLSLALALAIGLAIAFALTQPEPAGAGAAWRRIVIVIDNSPTMRTLRGDGRTRFEHALETARGMLAEGGTARRILVTDTGGTLGSRAFEAPRRARAVLDSIEIADDGAPRFPVLDAADRGDEAPEVVFITDGVAPITPPPGTRLLSVFEPAPNVGITAFEVRSPPGDARRFEAFVAVANAAPEKVSVTISIAGAGHDAIVRELDIAARDTARLTIPVAEFGGGTLQATARVAGDSYVGDDAAYAFMPVANRKRVALVSAGNRDLERALRLDPRIALSVLGTRQYAHRAGFDAYVFDRFAPAVAPAAPALLLRPPKVPWLPAPGREREAPTIDAWLEGQPVLDNVSLREVEIAHGAAFSAADASLVLARDTDGGALIIASAAIPRWVATGFSLQDSDFAAQTSFPIFVSNALTWLLDETPAVARPLGMVSVPLERARVLTPEGNALDTRFVPGATLFQADRPGVFVAEGSTGRLRVVINRFDPAVTEVNASRLATLPAAAPAGARAALVWEPWLLLMLGAFALMLLEWWTYHRRLTV